MKISVVIIAHNEEDYIAKCIESVLNQSKKPDEVIVVAHNCTDQTIKIAQGFPIKIVECPEQGGPIIARAFGIESCSREIICCTDGDCTVDEKWIEALTKPLIKNSLISISAGYTKIQNNIFWKLSCWWQFVINRKIINKKSHRFAWGSNFAFRKNDYDKVGGLRPFLKIHEDLKINYWAEDLYLSLALQKIGSIFFATKAIVYTYMPKEKSSILSQKKIVIKQLEDNHKIMSYFK